MPIFPWHECFILNNKSESTLLNGAQNSKSSTETKKHSVIHTLMLTKVKIRLPIGSYNVTFIKNL